MALGAGPVPCDVDRLFQVDKPMSSASLGFVFAISSVGSRGGSPRNTRNTRKRKAQRARIHAIPTSYARWFFVPYIPWFPSPAHRPRCIVAGEKHHAPIHHCIRTVKEGGGTCLHFEYGTSFPAWGDVPQFRFVADPSGPAPDSVRLAHPLSIPSRTRRPRLTRAVKEG